MFRMNWHNPLNNFSSLRLTSDKTQRTQSFRFYVRNFTIFHFFPPLWRRFQFIFFSPDYIFNCHSGQWSIFFFFSFIDSEKNIIRSRVITESCWCDPSPRQSRHCAFWKKKSKIHTRNEHRCTTEPHNTNLRWPFIVLCAI